jgi:hypothetical protein
VISRNTLFSLVILVCIANGIVSPWLAIALQIVPILMPELFPRTVGWALFFSSIFVSTLTLFGSGIIPALYERLIEDDRDSTVSMWIWLTLAVAVSYPALDNIQKLL